MGQARRNRQLAAKLAADLGPEIERELAIFVNPDVRAAVRARLIHQKKIKEEMRRG